MNKILCPIDFSAVSINAIEYATALGEKHAAALTLLFVFTEEQFNQLLKQKTTKISFDDMRKEAEVKVKALVEEIRKNCIPKGLKSCDYAFKMGDLSESISHYATQNAFRLVVMGTHGAENLEESIIGTNTVKVIEKIDLPVLCVPHDAPFEDFKRITYATDYKEEDKVVIEQLIALFMPYKSKIKVLHVGKGQEQPEQFSAYEKELQSYVSYEQLNFEYYSSKEDPKRALQDYMRQNNDSLLVLLTRHRNLIERIFHISTTKGLSFISNYPLLVFTI